MYSTANAGNSVTHICTHIICFIIQGHCSQSSAIINTLIELDCAITHTNGWTRGNQRSTQLLSQLSSTSSPQHRERHVLIIINTRTNGGTEEIRTKDLNNRWRVICVFACVFATSSLKYCKPRLLKLVDLTKIALKVDVLWYVPTEALWGGGADG